MTTTSTAHLVAALEALWGEVQTRHQDVPDVVVTIGAGSEGRSAGVRLGHFAASRWVAGDDAELHELFIGGEGLQRSATQVLGTLLHEAAHGIAHSRGVQDTSRQGRYHNKHFKALAEEVGIEVTFSPGIGYSTTTVPAVTAESYAAHVETLGAAITAWRRAEPRGLVRGRTSSNNAIALACNCPRKIRASRTVIEAGPIICSICDTPFTED